MASIQAGAQGTRGRAGAAAWLVLVLLLVLAGIVIGAGRVAGQRAEAELADRAAAAALLAASPLAAIIDKQRLIPMVLSRDPEVIALLAAPDDRSRLLLDEKLAEIADEASSAVIYVVGRDGTAIAASNDNAPGTFVGSDYGFRTYFTRAMAEGSALQFALGTVSGRAGLYLSRRVDSTLGPLGVVVVKVEFDDLEARWRESGLVVQVTDADGIVLAATDPSWRFGTTRPLEDEAATREALQLADAPMSSVPVSFEDGGRARIAGRPHVVAEVPVGPSVPGWELATFLDAGEPVRSAARTARAMAFLAGAVVASAGYGLMRRRRGALARQAQLASLNVELERRVAARTEELNSTNAALAGEISEREAAETRARRLREELAQANRLSILGQVTAGVAHEINQPLAAIRTYAQSGARLLDAGQTGDARDNLGEIVAVADRIGAITQALRGFARRGGGELRPVAVEEAVDGALTLLSGRIRDAGAAIVRAPRAPGVAVTAGRIRMEQILMNLLQNALDAVRDTPDPEIAIRIEADAANVRISVGDNGPGIPPEVRDQLFMPFTTTKETGLGLGLVISGDLASEFGGRLSVDPPGPRGASFTLELPRAE